MPSHLITVKRHHGTIRKQLRTRDCFGGLVEVFVSPFIRSSVTDADDVETETATSVTGYIREFWRVRLIESASYIGCTGIYGRSCVEEVEREQKRGTPTKQTQREKGSQVHAGWFDDVIIKWSEKTGWLTRCGIVGNTSVQRCILTYSKIFQNKIQINLHFIILIYLECCSFLNYQEMAKTITIVVREWQRRLQDGRFIMQKYMLMLEMNWYQLKNQFVKGTLISSIWTSLLWKTSIQEEDAYRCDLLLRLSLLVPLYRNKLS